MQTSVDAHFSKQGVQKDYYLNNQLVKTVLVKGVVLDMRISNLLENNHMTENLVALLPHFVEN